MSQLHQTAATLRFFGEDLDPDEITILLKGPPTQSCRKGDERPLHGGGTARERRGSWRRTVDRRSPGDLDAQIEELLADLTQDMTVWKALSDRYQADMFCGLFLREGAEGLALAPATLLTLGLRGLKLDLDIYGPEAS
ncbi:DUF4279 domain-containing protein [Caulobacter endophyticus]|uniref:DUF4279 domain-containing protein n=1 Tax=Caulobacter endophyticus TaxID=2172652 RepID=UPI002410278F|nr:DUF4279 domain-containing protein [Caulobacter endophyticus]MDG2527461.1 DUF4279 domain-containing protein [Caulobacter endophyticus]